MKNTNEFLNQLSEFIIRIMYLLIIIGNLIFFTIGLVILIISSTLGIFLLTTSVVTIITLSVIYGEFEKDIQKKNKRRK